MSFNSLFEMLLRDVYSYRAVKAARRFNSLFEMLMHLWAIMLVRNDEPFQFSV